MRRSRGRLWSEEGAGVRRLRKRVGEGWLEHMRLRL